MAIVRLRGQATRLLRQAGLVVKRVVNSKFVGVNPHNRYGKRIRPWQEHKLADGAVGEGFRVNEVTGPWASAMPPFGHPNEWFQRLRGASGPTVRRIAPWR